MILELSKLVVSTPDILLHPSGFWGLTMVQLPFCDHAGHSCDGFCHFADSIIKLLEKARSLVVDLPFPDVETLGVTWEALSLALTPPTEDTVKLFAGRNRGYFTEIDPEFFFTIDHRYVVKACILEAFRPFFESTSQSE